MKRARAVVRSIANLTLLLAALLFGAHLLVLMCTRVQPPHVDLPGQQPSWSGSTRRLGRSHVKSHGGILQVTLEGTPEEIGYAHASLLRNEMIENETALWSVFEDLVPSWPVRTAIIDLSRWSFRDLDRWVPSPRRRELAAAAVAFHPDPFDALLPTWHRFLFLNALYDVSLFYEHSPLIGCSSVVVSGRRGVDGHTLLARNFDFETHEVFDRGKAVLLFKEDGGIPFASVAWPGLAGVASGMNARGVTMVVHGARARSPVTRGEPALLTVREALSRASTTSEAVEILASSPPMISHIVLVTDAAGTTSVVERVPGEPAFVRHAGDAVALSNHLEGPLASDPANQRILQSTSTRARRARLDELLSRLVRPATPTDLAAILRDRKGPGDAPLAPGDRSAIDAGIATHGVIADASAHLLWVSEGPHLDGRFVRFDLDRLFSSAYEPEVQEPIEAIP